MFAYIYIHPYIHIYIQISFSLFLYIFIYIHAYLSVCMCVCVCRKTHTETGVSTLTRNTLPSIDNLQRPILLLLLQLLQLIIIIIIIMQNMLLPLLWYYELCNVYFHTISHLHFLWFLWTTFCFSRGSLLMFLLTPNGAERQPFLIFASAPLEVSLSGKPALLY